MASNDESAMTTEPCVAGAYLPCIFGLNAVDESLLTSSSLHVAWNKSDMKFVARSELKMFGHP
jgi:hypothetical protein